MSFTKGCISQEKENERRNKISNSMKGRKPKNFEKFIKKAGTFDIKKNNSLFKEGKEHPKFSPQPTYTALHAWARGRMPKKKLCGFCGSRKNIELSNVSGDYLREMSDWQWLCAKCHRAYDKGNNNIKQKWGNQ